jgi:hypothetical protein
MALPSFSSILGNQGQLDSSNNEDEGGLVCEMRTFEERFDSKGEQIRLEVGRGISTWTMEAITRWLLF